MFDAYILLLQTVQTLKNVKNWNVIGDKIYEKNVMCTLVKLL